MSILGYSRISSRSQEDGNGLEAQRRELREAGAERIYEDVFTGTVMDRPAWDAVCAELMPGDTLVVARLDRIARTAAGGVEAVRGLLSRGVSVNILNMGLVDDSTVGRLILNIMFAFAEFEHDLIVERMAEGKGIARQREGYREGRPRAEVDEALLAELCRKVDSGDISARAAARELGVSERTFRRRRSGYAAA
jgi:DNA invertase Pin-like site-specific DNA recombinase